MPLTLHQLRIFSAVASHRNVSEAAGNLHISQPALSQQLKLLEVDLGLKLYRKISRGIELTEEGKAFLSDTERILRHVETLKRKITLNSREGDERSLTVGGSPSQCLSFLPLILAVFKEIYPKVQVSLRTNRSDRIEELVLESQVEIGLITSSSHFPLLNYEPYRQEKLVPFASRKHPLAKKERITLAELAAAPLIVRMERQRPRHKTEELLNKAKKLGSELNIFMRCESSEAVKTAVKAGLGVGFLYESDLGPELIEGKVNILKVPDLKTNIQTFIVHHKDRQLSPQAQDFIRLLRESPRKTKWLRGSLAA